jgi:hypothetical protein
MQAYYQEMTENPESKNTITYYRNWYNGGKIKAFAL